MQGYKVYTYLFHHACEYSYFEYFLPHFILKWPCEGFAMDDDLRFTLKKGNWIYLGDFMQNFNSVILILIREFLLVFILYVFVSCMRECLCIMYGPSAQGSQKGH